MNRYRFQLRPDVRYALSTDEPALTANTLTGLIEDVIIHELAALDPGYLARIDVELNRPTHEQAVDEIAVAFQRLGYSILEGEIVE